MAEQKSTTNRRKGMFLIGIFINAAEEESLKESLKDPDKYGENIIEILNESQKRGDIRWTR